MWDLVYDVIVSSSVVVQRRSECLPKVHCVCVSYKMAEFSFARRVFTVFLSDIFTGLESWVGESKTIHTFFVFLSFHKRKLYRSISSETYIFSYLNCDILICHRSLSRNSSKNMFVVSFLVGYCLIKSDILVIQRFIFLFLLGDPKWLRNLNILEAWKSVNFGSFVISLTECWETWHHSGNAETERRNFLVNDSDF